MGKPVILTGLRANNQLHLGNYLGALLPMVDMANRHAGLYQINLFVPDLHSFTTPIDHSQLYEQTLNNIKMYVASGLNIDSPDVFVYRQSFIPAHSELTWILDCFTGFGEMRRMTQFKDKGGDQENASLGLFNYPVLMAADILLYGATYVPVGDDQTQHLEFTRDIAERLNNKFGDLFTVPLTVQKQQEFFGKDQGLRIRDLSEPTKKMSKSAESDKGVIFLTDSADAARQKIMIAATDSLNSVNYDYEKQPGISNLLDILTLLGGNKDEFIGQNQYGALKERVAEVVLGFLNEFQGKLGTVDESKLLAKIESSEGAIGNMANETLQKVQRAVGLRQ